MPAAKGQLTWSFLNGRVKDFRKLTLTKDFQTLDHDFFAS
jgi:hypothetical protein